LIPPGDCGLVLQQLRRGLVQGVQPVVGSCKPRNHQRIRLLHYEEGTSKSQNVFVQLQLVSLRVS